MRERGLDRRYGMEIFLRFAAYQTTHSGKNPPPNSFLWNEHARLWEESHHRSLLARLFGRGQAEPEWHDAIHLERFPFEISFLNDDFSVEDVQERLQAWPMISDFQVAGTNLTGEWFTCRIDVIAQDRNHARKIVECIFLLRAGLDSPEIEGFETLP